LRGKAFVARGKFEIQNTPPKAVVYYAENTLLVAETFDEGPTQKVD
jgi:hypothetical protein